MAVQARLRADVDLRKTASANAASIERFPTNCLVEILEDQGDWLRIKAVRIKKTLTGFVPRPSLIFPPEPKEPVFPLISLDGGARLLPSVAGSLPLQDFLAWQAAGGQPAWINAADWSQLNEAAQLALIQAMTAPISNAPERWNDWLSSVNADNRQAQALMDEWVVFISGGREVYAIRDHYVYKKPTLNDQYWGSALKGQMMRWTGRISTAVMSGKARSFYEVEFYRMRLRMLGWFRADVTAEYNYPTDLNDPEIESNSQNVFDLTQPILRLPQDPEIAAAKAAGYTGAQYIDIRKVVGKAKRHYSLCGEFCVAALAGLDIIPVLTQWLASKYARAPSILNNPQMGTGVGDLQSILKLYNLKSETYNSAAVPPQTIKQRLLDGQFAISGCGINSSGKVKAKGSIRHWVVVEDVLPVSNSGWVRVYNPFQNREEVYELNLFLASAGTGMGLWITMNKEE